MAKADCVHSTPPANTSATSPSQQEISSRRRRHSACYRCRAIRRTGDAWSHRRSRSTGTHAYAAWLHMERGILCGELWPDMGDAAEKWKRLMAHARRLRR
jgi:hypothetical protein